MHKSVVLLACLLLGACGSSDGSGGAGGSGGSGGVHGTDASSLCAPAFAGCSTYTDATADGANRTITFTFAQYTPNCLQIKAGQMVTFSGDFVSHPLAASCGAADVITNGTGTSKSFTFQTAGDYGYYCRIHGTASGTGMAGSIRVVP